MTGTRSTLLFAGVAVAMLVAACGQPAAPTPAPTTKPAAPAAGTQAPAGATQAPAATKPAAAPTKVEPLTIKFAHAGSDTHPYSIGIRQWQPILDQMSGGAVKLQVFGNAQLGSERELAEGTRLGTIDMTSVAADGALPGFVPDLQILAVPYLFRDRTHAHKVLAGDVGKDWEKKLEAQNLVVLTWWELGFRNMTTKNTPINSPADLQGKKMRVQESKIWLEFMRSLGAIPTPIPFGELYTALQQGVVDGQENPFVTIVAQKFYEVQKQVAITEHVYTALPVMASKRWWDGLTPAQKQVISESLKQSQQKQRDAVEQTSKKSIEFLKGQGVNITTPNKQPFADRTKDVPKSVSDQINLDTVQKIKDVR